MGFYKGTRLARLVIRMRLLILSLAAILLFFAFNNSQTISYDGTLERYFVEGDPVLTDFQNLIDLFGDNEYLVVGIDAREQDQDVFEPETLEVIAAISDFLEAHPTVTQVRSLTEYQYIQGDETTLTIGDLIENIDSLRQNPALLNEARTIMRGEKLALNSLITEDFQHTRIAARVMYRPDTAEHKVALVQEFQAWLEEQNFTARGYNLRISGIPRIDEAFETHASEDSGIIYPLMAVLMFGMLVLSFRNIGGTFLPWLVIAMGAIYLFGVQGMLGFPSTSVNQTLVPTLIIIGIAITIHVLVVFYQFRSQGQEAREAASSTIVDLWWPASFTALTTAAGFLALASTRLVPIREFAVLGAIGVVILFAIAIVLLPCLLSFTRHLPNSTRKVLDAGLVTRIADSIPDFTSRHRKKLLVSLIAVTVFVIASIPSIGVDVNYIEYFKENDPARQDVLYFDDTFQGAMNFEVIIDAGEPGAIRNPAFLTRVDALQNYLESLENTGTINSVVDYLKQINQILNSNNPEYYRIPDDPRFIAQALFLYASAGPDEDLSDLKDFDDRYLRLTVPIRNMPSSVMAEELAEIQQTLASRFGDLVIVLTGGMVMQTAQENYISDGMYLSFSIALIVIAACFIALFRSVKYGMLSLIPSVLPILTVGGLISLFGINLDLGTVIVGAMTMGIAVDDSIHVMSRYLQARKQGADTATAVHRAMHESGRAVIFSSVILVVGFSVLMFASIIPLIYVGLFGAGIMLLALIGDLLFLPGILFLIDGRVEERQTSRQGKNADNITATSV